MLDFECPYCYKEPIFVTSKKFYGKCYGINLYVCYECDARVGTHGKSKRPKGTLANKKLRSLRSISHCLFDPLWKGKYKKMSRQKAYKLLSELMGLSKEKAHIAMMNEEECILLIKKIKEYRNLK